MNAADPLAPPHIIRAEQAEAVVAARLAHGNGQGVAILPDGTLWALTERGPLYELVPLSAEAGDTDG